MIKRIKDLLSNFSNQEEEIKDEKISSLDKACSALLIEVAYADKIFDESEIKQLQNPKDRKVTSFHNLKWVLSMRKMKIVILK